MNSNLIEIANLLEDIIDVENPNPKVFKDADGNPLVGGQHYIALDETVVPVWSVTGPELNPNDAIYMVNLEKKSYFVFTPKEFTLQFKSEPVKAVI